MSIKGNISPRIVQSISTLYNDANRVLLEFIDNSIDSAEEYFESSSNTYTKPIAITLEIKGKTWKGGSVVILDNCKGISNIEKIVQNIGNSDKKAQPWTNGQFGYGMCSFIACCEQLQVISKAREKKNALQIIINREHFSVDNQEDFLFSDPKEIKDFEYESGTKVTLQNFDKASWRNIDIEEIKTEVEKHFELLLSRVNLQIKLISEGSEYICKPFDYSVYEGESLEEEIKELPTVKDIEQPIHFFIKLTRGKDLNKRPVFIIKGRRISEIKDIKAFKSNFKSDIWNHPNITGYVELGNYIEPDISRTGFAAKYKDRANALFDFLISKEPVILDLIKEGNEQSQEKHYQQLEDILSNALSKLARLDSMNFRTEYISGKDISLQNGAIGSGDSIMPPLSPDPNGPNEGIENPTDIEGTNPNDELGGNNSLDKENDNPFDEKDRQGAKRKKSGFNIKISDLEPNTDAKTGKKIKSRLLGNTIEIFRKHSDFESRMEHFRGGEPKVSQRLITYLAGEITVHYKDKYYMKSGQPEYNKEMFESLVGSIYLFEDLLKDAVGKNLSSWNN